MNGSCLVLAEHWLQVSVLAPRHFTLQESAGFSGSYIDLCLPEQCEHWNSPQIFHKIIKSSSRDSAAGAHFQQSSPCCHVSNHLATVLVFFVLFLLMNQQHVSKDSRGVPSFSTGLLTGGLFLASPEAWGHLSTGAANISEQQHQWRGRGPGQPKRLNLQQIQKLSYSLTALSQFHLEEPSL